MFMYVAVRTMGTVRRPGCSASPCRAMTARSARACSVVTPGLRRPMATSQLALGLADHGEREPVEDDRPAEDRGVAAERAPPEAVAQDRHRAPAGPGALVR